MTQKKIKVKKRGGAIGIWFFKKLIQFFGVEGAYGFLYIVCVHYLVFDRHAFRGAKAYIIRRFPGINLFKLYMHVYKLFVSQGQQLIDRYAIISGSKQFTVALKGGESIEPLLSDPAKGFVLLTAHIGNWQVAMTTLGKFKRKISLVMLPEENQALKQALAIGGLETYVETISPLGYLGGSVEIVKALSNGAIVSFMGDRHYGSDALAARFLGDTAYFPYGAFSIAAAVGCPVVIMIAFKNGRHEYLVDVENVLYPSYKSGNDKKALLKGWLDSFAVILEKHAQEYPYQCFLFTDVWRSPVRGVKAYPLTE